MKNKLLLFTSLLFLAFSMPTCKGPNCLTYSSSKTTGKLSKAVKKSDKAKKKKNRKKSGGKMKTGKPLF